MIITANIVKNNTIKVSLLYTYKVLFIQSITHTVLMHVCSIVLHTLVPHALHELHTKRHATGINLVFFMLK